MVEESLASAGNGEQERKVSDKSGRPWVRFVARFIDYNLFGIVFALVLLVVAPRLLIIPEFFLGMLILFLWVFVEAGLLSTWGTTPGKWLLKTRVRDGAGNRLNFSRAFARSASVWLRGMGMGLPIISLITLAVAHKKLLRDGITVWDREGGFVVSHEKIGVARTAVALLFMAAIFLALIYNRLGS
ncbi:MAG: RDD family protein [Candidatus Aminicenantes bacterium]|nr:RDD family protein [Candidatus Aminicenantes bacterium]